MIDLWTSPNPVAIVDPAAVEQRPWRPLDGTGGVTYKVLWRGGNAVAGLLRFGPRAVESPHVHVAAAHHMWIVEGQARIAGSAVGPGSYVHVPPGARHAAAAGPDGCTMFYLYLPSGDATGARPGNGPR